jgi:NAD-dependent dihydropyrimidine dehydrogenase PreA subunit
VRLEQHPSVISLRARQASEVELRVSAGAPPALSSEEVRRLALEAGADDVGFVEIGNPAIAGDRARIEDSFPGVRSLVSIVVRMQQENVRSLSRSVANQAFHTTGHEVDETCRRIVLALQDRGVRACNPSMAFPMEVWDIPEQNPWVVSHKPVAQAAGLGKMGLHRSVIHPRFGSFILLGTVLIDREMDSYSKPLDYNPCVDCRLCVAACPVGAISADGHFDASSCATHNYREFLGGFTDWVETVVGSNSVRSYRNKVEDGETLSMWQSLAYGPNYKAAYCLSVCPAGEDVLGPFLDKKGEHIERVLKPLQQKEEPLYVRHGSDAAAYASKRFPHKRLRYIRSGIRPTSVKSFLASMHWLFQREQSTGLDAVYHFVFRGKEKTTATAQIRERTIDVRPGLVGEPSVTIRADSEAWVKFLRGELPLPLLLARGQLSLSPIVRGARLLQAFGKCFPS